MGRRGCASAMGMIKFPSSCSSPKALCNQFIDYYICSRGVFCINHIKLRNFVVITIECSIATVDRGSIMTRIYRWSMMVYSSLQAEFMVTKYDGHIHRYGALVFGKLVIYVSKSIDNDIMTVQLNHCLILTHVWVKNWIPIGSDNACRLFDAKPLTEPTLIYGNQPKWAACAFLDTCQWWWFRLIYNFFW